MASSNANRYLIYAIGEVLLVIVGILIALQIDNWNQEQQEQEHIAEYARALINDLEADIDMVEPIIAQAKKIVALRDGLNQYMRNRQIEDVSNLDLFYLTSQIVYRPYSWNRAALQQLMNSGSLRQMKNTELVRAISDYDAFTRHLDEDFANDRRRGERAELAATEIVDANYPEPEGNLEIFDWSSPYSFPPSELYEAYSDVELQLLTDDITKVRVMVNLFDHLGGVRIRSDHELPRLKEQARELIQLLEADYPE